MLEMHALNRISLTEYFRTKHSFEGEDEIMDHEWADENIDEEIKELLSSGTNSVDMPLDMVAHMEYFYNTLDCHFKTQNPFKCPEQYPALSHKFEGEKSLFE